MRVKEESGKVGLKLNNNNKEVSSHCGNHWSPWGRSFHVLRRIWSQGFISEGIAPLSVVSVGADCVLQALSWINFCTCPR